MSVEKRVARSHDRWFDAPRVTIILAVLTLLVLALSAYGSLRDAYERGGIYLFSREFLEDIPRRLTGPGRLRFILQPLIAIMLGVSGGLADAREGRPPFLYGLFFHKELRGYLVRSGLRTVINLLLMGILMDALFQWIILGVSHAGAALVVGPVLVLVPYAIARALSNRASRPRAGHEVSVNGEREVPDSFAETPQLARRSRR
jgi:hypothetical protein